MRYLGVFLFIGIVLLQLSCKKDPQEVDSSKLEGKWKLVGRDFGLPDWKVDVEDGEELTFYPDSAFSKGVSKCSEGPYSVSGKFVTFDYSCPDKETLLSEGIQKWIFSIKDGNLILTPTFLICDEGCTSFYKKISD